jgi:hypothetical protein
MTVPDGTALAAIAALAGYFAWQNRQIVKSYFEQVPKQTEALQTLISKFDEHDRLSAQAHQDSCRAMREITSVLKDMYVSNNGKNRPQPQEERKQ